MIQLKDMLVPLFVGGMIRIIAVYIGMYIDSGVLGQLHYTDIDYSVFSHAARYTGVTVCGVVVVFLPYLSAL